MQSVAQSSTDVERLILFKDLVHEYDSMAAAFPIDRSGLMSSPGFTRSTDWWPQLIRAFALRKFFLQKSDPVHCYMIYRAYLNAVGEPIETDQTFEEYSASVVGLVGRNIKRADGAVPAKVMVEDLLYGVYLHGHPDRYEKVQSYRNRFDGGDIAIRSWTTEAEKHLHWLYHLILVAEVKGRLSLPE